MPIDYALAKIGALNKSGKYQWCIMNLWFKTIALCKRHHWWNEMVQIHQKKILLLLYVNLSSGNRSLAQGWHDDDPIGNDYISEIPI